jgi:hypothetical protein
MTTSANIIEYTIKDEIDNSEVGNHRQNILCKTKWNDLCIKYFPLVNYSITAHGYDEQEKYWEDEPINLKKFLFEKAIDRSHLKIIGNYYHWTSLNGNRISQGFSDDNTALLAYHADALKWEVRHVQPENKILYVDMDTGN